MGTNRWSQLPCGEKTKGSRDMAAFAWRVKMTRASFDSGFRNIRNLDKNIKRNQNEARNSKKYERGISEVMMPFSWTWKPKRKNAEADKEASRSRVLLGQIGLKKDRVKGRTKYYFNQIPKSSKTTSMEIQQWK